MPNLVDSSGTWGWSIITIANPAAATQGDDIPCKSCQIYNYTGSASMYVGPTAAKTTTSAPLLPTTFATAKYMPVDNVNKLWVIGTAAHVAMVVYRQ